MVSGRYKIFQTVESLEEAIDSYFADADVKSEMRNEKYPVYSMSGLALYLDMSRQTLINYGKDEIFFDTIRKAKSRVENCVEDRMISGQGNAAGLIFNAKNNFDWTDKIVQERSGEQRIIVSSDKEKELLESV